MKAVQQLKLTVGPLLHIQCGAGLTRLFLNFTERGVVWEETIILLPDNVHYVFLSATIPNASQFAGWVAHLHKQVKTSQLCAY